MSMCIYVYTHTYVYVYTELFIIEERKKNANPMFKFKTLNNIYLII